MATPVEFYDAGVSLLEQLLSDRGGYAMIEYSAYFDESYDKTGRKILCVAGYLIGKQEAISMSQAWQAELAKWELPYFHMVDCAHGAGVFAKLSKADRIAAETAVIEIVKSYTWQGIGAMTSPEDYTACLKLHPWFMDVYSFCIQMVLYATREWIEKSPDVDGISYFFESGYKTQPDADRLIQTIYANEDVKEQFKYRSHCFVEKKYCAMIQAADLYAYQLYKDQVNKEEGRLRRKDYEALLLHTHKAEYFSAERLNAIADGIAAGFSS